MEEIDNNLVIYKNCVTTVGSTKIVVVDGDPTKYISQSSTLKGHDVFECIEKWRNQSEIEKEYSAEPVIDPIVNGLRNGRNSICPCGSGRKFKKCCKMKGIQ